MSSFLNAAVALAAAPALASTGSGSVPPETSVSINWVRQVARSGVQSTRGTYSTSFEINSAQYELESSVQLVSPANIICRVKCVSDVPTNDNLEASIDATPASTFAYSDNKIVNDVSNVADIAMFDDALKFAGVISDIAWKPAVWSDEGEVVFEWINAGRHAIVSLEGDGTLGYTVLKDGKFVSGQVVGAPVTGVPHDLMDYLQTTS
ncbi:hypothetical protein [Agrobacterium radiobacter]|uniref:hypothetical protein n=1 Tax=Agrobacterium radiobacter TaxID=362 RepID=UPI003F84F758